MQHSKQRFWARPNFLRKNLRVIEASVIRGVTSTNTIAPTIMIAEKSAAIIKRAARQRLAA
jgi:choline dehydrogenase-like flavoprotein